MHRYTPLINTVHTALLALAAGVLLTVGVTAAVAFSVSAGLTINVSEFDAVDDPHNRLLPGLLMNTVFRIADALVAGLILLASACLLLRIRALGRAILTPVGVLSLAAGTLLLALTLFQTLLFRPALNANLDAYHDAARAGDTQAAATPKAAFDRDHPKATLLLMTQFGVTLVCIALNTFTAAAARDPHAAGNAASTSGSTA